MASLLCVHVYSQGCFHCVLCEGSPVMSDLQVKVIKRSVNSLTFSFFNTHTTPHTYTHVHTYIHTYHTHTNKHSRTTMPEFRFRRKKHQSRRHTLHDAEETSKQIEAAKEQVDLENQAEVELIELPPPPPPPPRRTNHSGAFRAPCLAPRLWGYSDPPVINIIVVRHAHKQP